LRTSALERREVLSINNSLSASSLVPHSGRPAPPLVTRLAPLSLLCSRSSSRDRKRGRWEDDRDRRSESSSGPSSRERSHASGRSRNSEDAAAADRDRERERDREKEKEKDEEKEEDQQLKPAWIRCTHAENNYSNDPMDQVVLWIHSSIDYICGGEGLLSPLKTPPRPPSSKSPVCPFKRVSDVFGGIVGRLLLPPLKL